MASARRATAEAAASGQQHTCTVCRVVGPWGPSWQWYGSYRDLDEGRPVAKICSDACRRSLRGKGGAKALQRDLRQEAARG